MLEILVGTKMSHLDLSGCKKRKRGERVFRFNGFGELGYPVQFDGSFRQNVKALVEFGHFESNLCNGNTSWSFLLEVNSHPPIHIVLYVVEEPVESSPSRHCKHCKYIGWGHHLICNKKYHFLLSSKETEASGLLELQGHIMHGVFHSNGFGHLLCVNGVEMGSEVAGHQIMDFWDRLCKGLGARKVSLNDISQKIGMELRLLHGVAYSEPWFGRWGYRFGRGCFAVTQPMYQKAIEAIQAMPLCLLIHHLSSSNVEVIFSRYQTLSCHSLVTLGDLFHFMLELKCRLPKENCMDSSNSGILLETTCRWSPKRLEMATRVIVEALRKADSRWVSRQEVRDAARLYIGDTGLLDFVLKSLGNHVVGNYLVRRSLNPVTKVLEYCLEDISNVFPNQEAMTINNSKVNARYRITRVQIMKDMFYLYDNVLKEQKQALNTGILSALTVAARVILDTKYLVKDYYTELHSNVEIGLEEKLKLLCTVLVRNNGEALEGTEKKMPPYECILLKNNATVDDLKQEVERRFRDLYWGLKSFVAESIVNLDAKGTDMVFGLFEVGQKIVFAGSDKDRCIITEEIYERNQNHILVDCPCGTKNEDGERMISCDICEVWQHTRCVRIPNNEEIPHIFLCNHCEQEIVHLPSLP